MTEAGIVQFAHLGDLHVVLLLLTTAITWSLAIIVWRQRGKPGGLSLGFLSVCMGIWALGSCLEYMSVNLEGKEFWVKLAWLGIANVPILLLLASLRLAGAHKLLQLR